MNDKDPIPYLMIKYSQHSEGSKGIWDGTCIAIGCQMSISVVNNLVSKNQKHPFATSFQCMSKQCLLNCHSRNGYDEQSMYSIGKLRQNFVSFVYEV